MAITVTPLNIIPSKYAEVSNVKQYTSGSGKTLIDKFTATNVGTSNASLSVWIVQSGGNAGNDNLIIDARVLAPGETYSFPPVVGQILEQNDFISTLASSSNSITIRATGRVITTT